MEPSGSPPSVPSPPVMARPVVQRTGPLDLDFLTPRQARLDLMLVVVVAVVVLYAPGLLLWFTQRDSAAPGSIGPLIIFGKLIELTVALVLASYLVRRNGISPRVFGVTGSELATQLGWSGLTLVAAFAYLLLASLFIVQIWQPGSPELEENIRQRVDVMRALNFESFAATVALMLIVGFQEELIFRGLLLPYLRRLTGAWWIAILLSSTLFGVLHFAQGGLAMVQITGLGMVFAIFFVASRSLLAVALAHFAFNVLQVLLGRIVLPEALEDEVVAVMMAGLGN